jgi:predicted amidohydrolase
VSESELKVALVQAASSLEPRENREALATLTPTGVDLVVFPEVFQRDFGQPGSDVGPYAETPAGEFATTVAQTASAKQTTIVAGMFERSDDAHRPYNTLIAKGAVDERYRKVHLYDSFGFKESDSLRRAEIDPVVFDLQGFRVGLMTCYDLRFPEYARLLVEQDAEVLVLPAAWVAGERKVDHWRTLLRARAIENTCYVVAVGQPGPRYCGHSSVIAPNGDVVVEAGADAETLTATLSRDLLDETRRTNPSLLNRRL